MWLRYGLMEYIMPIPAISTLTLSPHFLLGSDLSLFSVLHLLVSKTFLCEGDKDERW